MSIVVPALVKGLAEGASESMPPHEKAEWSKNYSSIIVRCSSESALRTWALYFIGAVLVDLGVLLDTPDSPPELTEIMLQTCRVSAHFRIAKLALHALHDAREKLTVAQDALIPKNPQPMQPGELFIHSAAQMAPLLQYGYHTASAAIAAINAWYPQINKDLTFGEAADFMIAAGMATHNPQMTSKGLRRQLLDFLRWATR